MEIGVSLKSTFSERSISLNCDIAYSQQNSQNVAKLSLKLIPGNCVKRGMLVILIKDLSCYLHWL